MDERAADALRGVLDTVQLCARNPIKARVMPGTYAGKLQKACAAIEDAMKGIGLSSAAVAAEARNAARDLQAEFTDLSGFLTTAQQSNEAFMAQILTAVKNNHEETLRSIAAQNNLSGVEELKRRSRRDGTAMTEGALTRSWSAELCGGGRRHAPKVCPHALRRTPFEERPVRR